MGLENRDYMRQSPGGGSPFGLLGGGLPSATKQILIAIVAVFLVQLGMNAALGPSDAFRPNWFEANFSLSWQGISHGKLWQFVTYAFLHEIGPFFLHILFNGYVIYVFGRTVEMRLGRAGLFRLFFGSVVGGALLWLLISGRSSTGYVLGASAGAYGLIVAYATLNPNRMLMLVFPPMLLPAKWMAIGIIGIDLLMVVAGQNRYVAWQAHLGGALVGYLMVRYGIGLGGRSLTQVDTSDWGWSPSMQRPLPQGERGIFRTSVFQRMAEMFRSLRHGSSHGSSPSVGRGFGPGPGEDDFHSPDYVEREIDPILDKISERGFQSLSRQERLKLEQFHRRRH
ncbi:MAG: rhomboid family intramembrane serine protease [Verrucomicrobiota bacterium]|jgi:membrane associated rhomboid family serine protease|nr:rhomboid family intramembrane serine protease [Verrucomicrobiota bacterium]MDD8046074.1 rhomboid family intramembrane serine protease [Verrucomicrobiota bacterium]MDD8051509.1 rhomboid family intramembrane serine protease [Verrucomicrobiota bacterium]MDI9383505.1 rhomboid family intramembrane serine protease [Verrucomicrobiota bacterium]HCF96987.1 hypothetical protein [Verrucomicrobiota bacterium]